MSDIVKLIKKDLENAESNCKRITTSIQKKESDLAKLKDSHLIARGRVQGLNNLLATIGGDE